MYLEKLIIKNFRSINELTLNFNKGLNVLIGENNSGKTAIFDSLRLCLGYGNQKRDIYISLSDFHIDKSVITDTLNNIEFHLYFKIEDIIETAWFNDMLNTNEDGTQDIQLHFKYFIDEKNNLRRVKYKVWGGSNEGQMVTPEVLSLLYHVHLDALRDAEQHLRPIRGNRLGQLYSNIQTDTDKEIDKEKKKGIASRIKTSVDADADWIAHIKNGKTKINEHLKETNFTEKHHPIDVDFLPYDFNKLVDNLKMQIPVYTDALLEGDTTKQKYFDLYQNGLGYNNLIYTATVLGDLKQRKEFEKETYIALLIEEPEAHLHPQLQNLFFNYLNKLDTELGFQIFITSHSPTITAKADLKSVIVLQNKNNKIHSLSILQSGLTDLNRKYLHKFLDVTKSQLFFANGVILVEGISEALLMPIFSKIMGDKYDIEKAGIELVNINGIAFEHFGNLFNNDDETKILITKCCIITDDDRNSATDEISSRAAMAKDLEKHNLKVALGEVTFEFELFIAGNNKDILLNIFEEMYPKAAQKIQQDTNIKVYAKSFLEKVKSNKAKSELAHRLALKLSTDATASENFTIPEYIQNAIKFVLNK
ncbi:putative ATP-dependent endonuclease of OLD family [Methylobacter tundripaludum]|uniref:Putative ATP-dependent endonuclease of OLD family n=1 Tax=Methylobacter tundripaludum TaxID=173365 RepID=A0A2S6GIE5_9GAMM|nr:AAA family ATPase [Methylobacter tundripaludum]PPK64931.1 putative ATP-dependent endonuclease of OLD family [Methylobacter tundripaludum]